MTVSPIPGFSWIPLAVGPPLGLALAIAHWLQTSRAVRRAVAEEGLIVRHLELRFLTRGPFPPAIGLPGISHSDTLYRVQAEDASGAPQVVWARVPVRWWWSPPRCATCRDANPERTGQGIGATAFYILVGCLTVAMLAAIISISAGRAFAATPPHPGVARKTPTLAIRGGAGTRERRARGDAIWEQTLATYATLQTYADSGTVDLVLGSVEQPLRERHTFHTYFKKPRFYLFDFTKAANADRVVVWGDLDLFHTWWKTTGVATDYPKGRGSGAFTMSVTLTKGSISVIAPLLFPGAGLVGTATQFTDPVDAGTEKVDGHECHKLTGVAKDVYRITGYEVNIRQTIIWIDVQSRLIRKVFEDAPKGHPAGTVSTTTTTFQPHANPTLDDSAFAFTPPQSQ